MPRIAKVPLGCARKAYFFSRSRLLSARQRPRISTMHNAYTAVIRQEGNWWIGWIEEVPGVNCQEASRDELLETLRVTLREALELNRQDAIAAAGGSYQEEQIAV